MSTTQKSGRPAVVSYEDVAEALATLTADGRPIPSLQKLREHLGRGSMTTIHKLRKQVAEGSLAKDGDKSGIAGDPLDDKLDPHYEAFKEIIRNEAYTCAEYEINEIRVGSDSIATAAEARRDKALQERHQLIKRVEAAESSQARALQELTELKQFHTKLLEELEHNKVKFAESRQKIAYISQELERVSGELNSQQQVSHGYQGQLAQEKKDRANDKREAKLVRDQLDKALNDSDNLVNVRTAALDAAKQANVEKHEDLLQARNANTLVHRQLDRANDASDKLQAESKAELKALLAEKNEVAAQLSKCKEKLKEEIDDHRRTQKMFDSNQKIKNAEIGRLNDMVGEFIAKSSLPE